MLLLIQPTYYCQNGLTLKPADVPGCLPDIPEVTTWA